MDHKNSQSASYAAAGVDITAGYRAVELMKAAWTMWAALAAALACPLPAWRSLCWCPALTDAAQR